MLEAMLANAEPDPLVSVKRAAEIWGVTNNAALKRMRRIGAKGLDGCWYARWSIVGQLGR